MTSRAGGVQPSSAIVGSLALLLLAAGCLQSEPTPPTPTSTFAGPGGCSAPEPFVEDSGFRGQNAYRHVLELTCDLKSNPPAVSHRVPGTPEREAAAKYLYSSLKSHGWTVSFQNFTGNDYEALPKGSLATYASPSYCSAAELARVRGLTFSNVVARRGTGGEPLILMAHYDSKLNASLDKNPANRSLPVPGANDGASGVGVLLEFARVLKDVELRRELRILLVDGEDGFEDCHPDAGSLYYAHSLPEQERDQVQGVLLLDMVGDLHAKYCMAGTHQGIAKLLQDEARKLDVRPVAEAPNCFVYDDHTPFEDLGIGTIDLIDFHRPSFPPYWHTREDTPDKLAPEMLRDVGRVTVEVARAMTV